MQETRRWQRVVSIFLALLLIIMMVMVPTAQAVAAELVVAGTLTVIAAIWYASGAKLPSGDDVYKAARKVYDEYIAVDPALRNEVHALGQSYVVRNGATMGSSVLRVSQRLWQAVCGKPAQETIVGNQMIGDLKQSFLISSFDDYLLNVYPYFYTSVSQSPEPEFSNRTNIKSFVAQRGTGLPTFYSAAVDYSLPTPAFVFYINGIVIKSNDEPTTSPIKVTELTDWYISLSYTSTNMKGLLMYLIQRDDIHGEVAAVPYRLKGGSFQVHFFCNGAGDYPAVFTVPDELTMIPVTGTIAKPAEDIAVKLPASVPKQATDGTITYPDLPTNQSTYQVPVADIPIPEGLTEVPEDVIVDITTGEIVDGSTDIPDNPDIPVNPDIPSTGMLQKIIDAINSFFDSPSDYVLDFSSMQGALPTDRFPFCIPFDFVRSIKVWSASAADFEFKIDFDTQYFSIHHTVDLSPFALPIGFFRYLAVVWFTFGLISKTRDLIKW